MNISLPEALKSFVDSQVSDGTPSSLTAGVNFNNRIYGWPERAKRLVHTGLLTSFRCRAVVNTLYNISPFWLIAPKSSQTNKKGVGTKKARKHLTWNIYSCGTLSWQRVWLLFSKTPGYCDNSKGRFVQVSSWTIPVGCVGDNAQSCSCVIAAARRTNVWKDNAFHKVLYRNPGKQVVGKKRSFLDARGIWPLCPWWETL